MPYVEILFYFYVSLNFIFLQKMFHGRAGSPKSPELRARESPPQRWSSGMGPEELERIGWE
jgi:hypothetical protein